MPIVAATRGTLSMSAEARPMTVAIISWLGRLLFKNSASSLSNPLLSRTPILIRIPRKKRIPDMSSLARAAGRRKPSRLSSPMCITSVRVHIAPRPVSIARYGGRPVSSLKTGTARSAAIPNQNTRVPRGAREEGSGRVDSSREESSSTWPTRKAREPTRQTTEGKKSCVTVGTVVSCPLIHSIVVVTSPMGVHTPPAFAATTTMAPKRRRSTSFGTNLRRRDTMTMVTVRLLRMEERKKVRNPIVQKSPFFDLVVILLVTTLKPW
mmetsp:Transcript_50929/g.75522  ORF Transcript_50929/g.75522 Transcript_50929/m.75522 type:complete len:266 (-) Transcript_50929:1238-2035(-)